MGDQRPVDVVVLEALDLAVADRARLDRVRVRHRRRRLFGILERHHDALAHNRASREIVRPPAQRFELRPREHPPELQEPVDREALPLLFVNYHRASRHRRSAATRSSRRAR